MPPLNKSALKILVSCWTLACLAEQNNTRAVIAIQESLKAGDLDKASESIDEALRQLPNDGGLLNLRGIVHARRKEIGEARKDFAEAARLSPELIAAWQNLARACLQTNEDGCALEAWQRVLRAKPHDGEAHESLAELYEKRGRFAESLRELDAGNIANLAMRCTDLSALGRISEAKTIAARLARQSDFSEGDLAGMAALDLPKAAGVVATLVEGLDARGVAGGASLRRLVFAYERLQRMADARRTLERIAKLEPDNTAHLLELARLAESSKDYEGALGYLAHARDLAPNEAQIHFLFGLVAGELNLPIEAKEAFDKALAIEPENPNYNYAMGSAILETRDAATAAGYLERFVRSRPADARGHYALGLAHFASGDYAEAKQQMSIAEDDPRMAAPAEYYLGRMARLEGDIDEATRRLRRSSALMPDFSETHTELARIAMLQGKTDEAKAELQRALRLAPDSFQANEQMLVLYKRTHDARAGKQAETLKKLDEARSKRAELMLRTVEMRP